MLQSVSWEMICIDYISPVSPAIREGHSYILINVDYLSRFLITTAYKLATAEEVSEIWNFGSRAICGWPRKNCCNNRSHFRNLLLKSHTEKHST